MTLAGKSVEVTIDEIPLDLVDLDEENPRVGFFSDSKAMTTGQPQSQHELEFALRNKSPDAYDKLKRSIEVNQGALHPIWVQKKDAGRFRTVEGNTRVLAYRDLHQKFFGEPRYSRIPSKILPEGIDPVAVDFIRVEAHLRGVTPWDAYERARYLYALFNSQGWTLAQLASQTRLNEREITASIEAYRTMKERYLTIYKDANEVTRFSYFSEYHLKRSIRDSITRNGFTIDNLCEWIGTGKLPRAADIRDLPDILDVPEARTEFLSNGYDAAMDVLSYIKPSKASPLYKDIARVIRGLDEISPTEITELKSGKGETMMVMLHTLDNRLDTVLSLAESKKGGKKRA